MQCRSFRRSTVFEIDAQLFEETLVRDIHELDGLSCDDADTDGRFAHNGAYLSRVIRSLL